MNEQDKVTFEEIFEQNKRRIHYQIHRLNIVDPENVFFEEGLVAMWNAYQQYEPDKGPMSTYFNYIIRHRLIDKLRKETRDKQHEADVIMEQQTQLVDGNYHHVNGNENFLPQIHEIVVTDTQLWQDLRANLTENQWKWVAYFIIAEWSTKEIANHEDTSIEAVKSWGKQVRKKLRDPAFRKRINWDIS